MGDLNLLHHSRLELHRTKTINPAIDVVVFLTGAGIKVKAENSCAHSGQAMSGGIS